LTTSTERIKFLADESCDFAVVRALRSAGYDVASVVESLPGAPDLDVLRAAVDEGRLLVTEDKDFGDWVFAHGEQVAGVLLIRFPAYVRNKLGESVLALIGKHGLELQENFTVLEPGRARFRKIK
jgi:predicted nuclease of predicted toxin-antitoxin system